MFRIRMVGAWLPRDGDARDKRGHDELESLAQQTQKSPAVSRGAFDLNGEEDLSVPFLADLAATYLPNLEV